MSNILKRLVSKHIAPGGFFWHILVFPQRFRRHGFKIFRGYWGAQEARRMVEPLKTKNFKRDHISIVIVSAGRKKYLERTIAALRKYFLYDSHKITWLIIDDYPTSQETRNYIKSLGIFERVIFNEQNRGLGYSLNRIFAEVKTEFVFYCEEDYELLRPVHAKDMIRILRTNLHLSQLMVLGTKEYAEAQQTDKGYFEYYKSFGFWPYLASMNFLREHLPFPFYFTDLEFTFQLHKKGWRTSGVFGSISDPPHVRHIGEERKVWVVK